MSFCRFISLIAMFALTSTAYAHDYIVGDVHIGHPYARPSVPGLSSGSAYLSITNKGKNSSKLIAVTSTIAQSTEIHSMSMEGDVMKMRQVSSIEIKPAEKITMKPGDGYHIMLIGLKQPLKVGDKFPLTLTFEKVGNVEVLMYVENQTNNGNNMTQMHH